MQSLVAKDGMSNPAWRPVKVTGPPCRLAFVEGARGYRRAAGRSKRRADRDPRYAIGRAERCSRAVFDARRDVITIVMGLDQHRAQITASG